MRLLILLLLVSCGNNIEVTRSVPLSPSGDATLDIEFKKCYNYPDRDCWYKIGTSTLHNPTAPAMVSYQVTGEKWVEFYYNNGDLHRFNDPAVIRYCKDGTIEKEIYFENGNFLFDTILKTC